MGGERKQWCMSERLLEDAGGTELDIGTWSSSSHAFLPDARALCCLLKGFSVGRLLTPTILQGCTYAPVLKSFILC